MASTRSVGSFGIVHEMEHAPLAHEARAQELQDEALIAVVRPDVLQNAHRVLASGDLRKPGAVFVVRLAADALDVAHHGETQRIRVDLAVMGIIEFRLPHHVGMRLEEFQKRTVADASLVVKAGHDRIMTIGRATFVHHLGLPLRIEILRDMPHEPEDLALPRLQARRGLLQKVQEVFLRQLEQSAQMLLVGLLAVAALLARKRLPQVVIGLLLVEMPLPFASLLRAKVGALLARIAMDAVGHQRMRRIEQALDRRLPVALLASRSHSSWRKPGSRECRPRRSIAETGGCS